MAPLRHINRYRDRHGRVRYYFRRPGGKNIPLPGDLTSPAFLAAYQAASKEAPAPIGEVRNAPGSVAQTVSLYLGSAAFVNLAPDTRRGRKNELERFRRDKGEKPIARLERRHLERYIVGKSPGSARNCLKALTPFLDWCSREGFVQKNVAAVIKRPPGSRDGYKTWTEDLIAQYRSRHPVGSKARRALELLINVGAARADAAMLGRQHVKGGLLVYRRHKTSVPIEIPVLSGLQAVIDEVAGSDALAFVATEHGTPYTKESFGNLFFDWCKEANIPKGYSAHGIRKYAATAHANNGATAHQLMAWFGWLSIREAERYTRTAERRRLAIDLGEKSEHIFPNPASRIS